jgi:hypothetical protein
VLSISTSPSSNTSVGTRRSGFKRRDLVGIAEGRPRPVLEGEPIQPQRNRDAPHERGVILADQDHGFSLLVMAGLDPAIHLH